MSTSTSRRQDTGDGSAGQAAVALASRIWSRGWIRRSLGALLGLAAGAVVGFYLTLAIFVAEARGGDYVFSLDDLTEVRWQVLPTIVGFVSGVLLGWRSVRALLLTLLVVLVCALALVPVGWFGGSALWVGRSAPWAGAVLASALGVLGGTLVAALVLRRRGSGGGGSG